MNRSLVKIQILVESKSDILQFERSNKVNYLVKEDPELALKIKADGVLLSDLEKDLKTMRMSYPTLLIGGLAMDIADCKNWEMKGVDFIQFLIVGNDLQDNAILGAELLQDMIPREEEYGWMIMSLNTPVFVRGISNFKALVSLLSKASIYGFVLTKQFEQNLSLEERIDQISYLFE